MELAEPANAEQAEPANAEQLEPANAEQAEPANAGQAEPANAEQVEPANVEPAEPITDPAIRMPIELFCKVMNMLELWEMITVRRVSHSWQNNIELYMFDKPPRLCLKLNIKKDRIAELGQQGQESRCLRTWEPNESRRRMQFDFVYQEPEIAQAKQAHISMRESAFNQETALAFGRFFPVIETLIIYWDTDDNEANIDSLVVFLSQLCSKLTTFGLIISGQVTNMATLPKICSAINTHGTLLQQLHLMVPAGYAPTTNARGVIAFNFYPDIELDNVIESITNFSFTGISTNVLLVLEMLCTKIDHQLDTLSIYSDYAAGHIENIQNMQDKFASVRRLQLVSARADARVNEVGLLLESFPNVTQLYLDIKAPSAEVSGFAWIRALQPLVELTELTLYNWKLDYLTKDIALGNVGHFESLNQVRKLTIASPVLFFHFRQSGSGPFFPWPNVHHMGHTISTQFPSLQELNIWSGDCTLQHTTNLTWQTVEQDINRELPTVLPQMPELRVNVQLRHPLLYNEYLSRSERVRRAYVNKLAEIDKRTLDDFNYWRENEIDVRGVDFLVAFLNGNFRELDREHVRLMMIDYGNFHRFMRYGLLGNNLLRRAEARENDVEDDEDENEDENEDEDEDENNDDEYLVEQEGDREYFERMMNLLLRKDD